jgi:hypothetical protein
MAKVFAKVSVEGTKPILFHTFPLDTLSSTKKKQGNTGDNNEEWKETVLMNDKRNLYVYNTYFQASIADGGKEIKAGRGNISRKVAGTLEVVESKILLDDLFVPEEASLTRLDTDLVYLDVRAVVNPMTKGRNLRYRIAARAGWKCQFTIAWDDRIVSKDQIKQCVETAGSLQGIGDGRKIGFGRFKLIDFKAEKN